MIQYNRKMIVRVNFSLFVCFRPRKWKEKTYAIVFAKACRHWCCCCSGVRYRLHHRIVVAVHASTNFIPSVSPPHMQTHKHVYAPKFTSTSTAMDPARLSQHLTLIPCSTTHTCRHAHFTSEPFDEWKCFGTHAFQHNYEERQQQQQHQNGNIAHEDSHKTLPTEAKENKKINMASLYPMGFPFLILYFFILFFIFHINIHISIFWRAIVLFRDI